MAVAILTLCAMPALAAPPAVQTAIKQAGAVDPVSGKKVKAADAPIAIFLDTIYKFGSAENLAKFRAAPERYATTHCPVSDVEVRIKDATQKTKYAGRTWYFCCADCKVKFEANPGDYVTYRCPACGGVALASMEGSVTAVYDGREMRFCCNDCKEKFDEDPAAYFAPVVPEGGAARDSLGAGSGK